MFLRNVGCFQRTTRRYIPEDRTFSLCSSVYIVQLPKYLVDFNEIWCYDSLLKIKLSHAMKTYGGGGIAPPFLTSAPDGDERSSRPGRFMPKNEPPYPLNRWLGRSHNRSRRCGEGENFNVSLMTICWT
jgi:hypothetical protein